MTERRVECICAPNGTSSIRGGRHVYTVVHSLQCPVTAEQGRTDEEHDEGPADPRAHPWLGQSCSHCGTPVDISPAFQMVDEGKGSRVHRARFCGLVLLRL